MSSKTKKQLGDLARALFSLAITAVFFFVYGGIVIAGDKATVEFINGLLKL